MTQSKFRLVRFSIVLASILTPLFQARADVRLPRVFSDDMVLQQEMRAPIWGWADEGERVTVEFVGQKLETIARGGKWMVELAPLEAGGPHELTVIGKNTVKFTNVLVGEVWICSGQSNMEFALTDSFEARADIEASANPMIRLLTVSKLKANSPTNNISEKDVWRECSPQTVPRFSAVAYYFGRDLQKARQVPVGLIHTSWGGSPAEAWMGQRVLEANAEYKKDIVDKYAWDLKKFQDDLAKWEQARAEAQRADQPYTQKRPSPPYWKPAELYNGMIAPLLPYAIRGAIWYQGESNASRAYQYRRLFTDMIRNWRRDWGADFTFLAVQLAPFMKIKGQPGESTWAELREAQNLAARVLPKVGVAVVTDVGEENDIHPRKKGPVGARLALAARGIAYGESIVYAGPTYRKLKVKGDRAIISFDHAGGGLEARGGELKGFALCGPDHKFIWAKAEIQADKVVVSAPIIAHPVAVRFGWADYPVVNLWNTDGLPASPFRTDGFPLTTAPKSVPAKK